MKLYSGTQGVEINVSRKNVREIKENLKELANKTVTFIIIIETTVFF